MAITTYSELLAAVASWLSRDDLTSYIPDFVTLFEAAAARRLNVRPQETTATLVPVSGVASLPSDYLGFRSVTWLGARDVPLEYAHPFWLRAAYPNSVEGNPTYFTIEGSELKVRPSSDTNISLLYYAKGQALADALGWLFVNHPDTYLFGALCEAYAFDKDEERAAVWKNRRDEAFDEIVKLNFREPSGLVIRSLSSIV